MHSRLGGIITSGVLMLSLVAGVILVQQRQIIQKKAAGGAAVLQCDSGPNPYSSTTIKVNNDSGQQITKMGFHVFRCPYIPGRVAQYLGSYKCEDSCQGDGPQCQEGRWDSSVSESDFTLEPGQERVFTVTANPCEIVQLDVQNYNNNLETSPVECHNVSSQHTVPIGEVWPGGIAFGINENATGYNPSTQTCPTSTPTTPPTPTPTTPSSPTATPFVPTATPRPTSPPGQPTYTPIPTRIYTPIPTRIPTRIPTSTPSLCVSPNMCVLSENCTGEGRIIMPGSCVGSGTGYVCCSPVVPPTNTPYPTQPVSGAGTVLGVGIVTGIGLLLLSLF